MKVTVDLLKTYATSGEVKLLNLNDLELDVEQIEQWRKKGVSRFLWLVKQSGTIMLPLRSAVNPVFCDCAYDVPCQGYEINLLEEFINPVSKERAVELIEEFPFDPAIHEIAGDLELKLRNLLKKKFVTDNMVNRATLNAEEAPLAEWYDYFNRMGNRLMTNLLSASIRKLDLGSR